MANINQRLNGLNPLAYVGVNAVQPPDFLTKNRPPTTNDSKNVYLGQIWLDYGTNTPPTSNDIYMLVSLDGNVATWVTFGGGDLETLTSNSGGAVGPDGANNINVVGDGTTIIGVGVPGTNTITFSTVGTGVLNTLTGNSGGAVPPTAGNINVLGTGIISVVGNPGTSTLTVTPSGSIASSFITSPATGTATPALGVLTFTNGNNITFTAGGSSVAAAVTGTTNRSLQLGNATGSLTSLGVATDGQIPIGSTGANPVLSTITAGANITVTNGAGTITIASTGGGAPASTCNFKVTTTDNTPIPNLTGDGSATLVNWPQVLWDVGANYGGGTFTAPATGYYAFYHWILFQGIDATNGFGGFVIYAKNGFFGQRNNTADTNLFPASLNTGAVPNYNSTTNMTIINMTAGDTMQCFVQWGNGAAAMTVGIAASNVAGGIINSHWGGYRIS